MPQTRTTLSLVLALLGSSAAASAQLQIPANLQNRDGKTFGSIAGFEQRTRHQYIVASSVVRQLNGSAIRGIRFRRDRFWGRAMPGGSSRLTVFLRSTTVEPADTRREFALNRPQPSSASFQGLVALPTSPASTSAPTWSAQDSVVIRLTQPFQPTAGQALCIEIEGEPIGAPADFHWWVDYDQHVVMGNSTDLGVGCGPTDLDGLSLAVGSRGLLLGGTVRAVALGRARTPGLLLFGSAPSHVPLDFLGMTGCTLYTQPVQSVPISHGPARINVPDPGATALFQIPSQPRFLGGRIFLQAANIELTTKSNAAGLTTTNGLRLDISSVLPQPKISSVIADRVDIGKPFPTVGSVFIGEGPVMRLETR